MSRNEHVNFDTSGYFHYSVTNTTAATDNSQNMSLGAGIFQRGIAAPVAWEPATAAGLGQSRLDSNMRLVVMMSRQAGIGAAIPSGSLRLGRGAGVGDVFVVALGGVQTGDLAVPVIIDNAFPPSLGTISLGAAIDDEIICEFFVKPNEAVAHVVSCSVFFMPSFGGQSGAGRGNILSGSAYY